MQDDDRTLIRDRDGFSRPTGFTRTGSQKLPWIIGIAAAIAIAAFIFYRTATDDLEEQVEWPTAPAAKEETLEPTIRHPIPAPEAAPTAQPLPALPESDAAMEDALVALLGEDPVAKYLVPKNVIRRIVVTIDNLPRKKVAVELRPLVPTPGTFVTSGTEEASLLAEENYARYEPLVKLVATTDARQLAELYIRFYPLFQEAYQDLGYPQGYFNDRLVAVIDHLLETPEVSGPVELVRPKVFYEYRDQDLENRSAGQKLLIRMGPQNAAAIKKKLEELRREVAGQTPPMTPQTGTRPQSEPPGTSPSAAGDPDAPQ
jgi:hypothetical protein